MTPQELRIAAETVWGEARGEPQIGKLAVAYVIRNRVALAPCWWGRDLISVCTRPWQFSCRNRNDPNCAKLSKVPDDDPVFAECRAAVEAAFSGAEPDPTHGGTTYKVKGTHATWDKAVEGVEPVQVGHHLFWRLLPNGRVEPAATNPA